jgi:hypothetical protein
VPCGAAPAFGPFITKVVAGSLFGAQPGLGVASTAPPCPVSRAICPFG